MSKLNKLCIIVSIICLIIPFVLFFIAFQSLEYPAFSLVGVGLFTFCFQIFAFIYTVVILILICRPPEIHKKLCIFLVALELIFNIVPFGFFIVDRQSLSVIEPVLSETTDADNYLIFDKSIEKPLEVELAKVIFPDIKDENIKLESYSYKYTPNIISSATIQADIKTDVSYFPELEKKLSAENGMRKTDINECLFCEDVTDKDCYAHYQTESSINDKYAHVTFRNDGTVEYYYTTYDS